MSENPNETAVQTLAVPERQYESHAQNRLKNEIGDFKYDNLKDDNENDILGLFQESYNPIGLHIDGGFNFNDLIYKQSLIPLTPLGSTVIFKNRFYKFLCKISILPWVFFSKIIFKSTEIITISDGFSAWLQKYSKKNIQKFYLSYEKKKDLKKINYFRNF